MSPLPMDVVIVGGGVAGLWLLDSLRRAGRSAVLVEADRLGSGQTVVSQGILHSGLKYSLQGMLTSAAREAREMPALWRQCLAGQCEPNLSQTRLLSDSFYLWGTDSAASKIGLLGARMGLRVTPEQVTPSERPAWLAQCPGAVYKVPEQVIAPQSLLECLASRNSAHLLKISAPDAIDFIGGQTGTVRLRHSESPRLLELAPACVVLTAGAGNERLRSKLGLAAHKMQRRPLHMVLVKGPLPEFHGHCLDGAKTRVSITSATDQSGTTVWQVGGQVAEDGVKLSPDELIALARSECESAIPGIDFSATEWGTYRVDRAEAATLTGGRPDSFKVLREGKILTGWPTKLVLAPQLASALETSISELVSRPTAWDTAAFADWPRPEVASPPWDSSIEWQRCPRRAAA